MQGQQVETLVHNIQSMDRQSLLGTLKNLDCDFAMDFTDEFLNSISTDRLKHIVLAASLHAHRNKMSPT